MRDGAVDISFRTATPLQIQQHTEIEYTLTREWSSTFSLFENNPLLKLIKLENKKKIFTTTHREACRQAGRHSLTHSLHSLKTRPNRTLSLSTTTSRIYSLKYFLSNTIISLCTLWMYEKWRKLLYENSLSNIHANTHWIPYQAVSSWLCVCACVCTVNHL